MERSWNVLEPPGHTPDDANEALHATDGAPLVGESRFKLEKEVL